MISAKINFSQIFVYSIQPILCIETSNIDFFQISDEEDAAMMRKYQSQLEREMRQDSIIQQILDEVGITKTCKSCKK